MTGTITIVNKSSRTIEALLPKDGDGTDAFFFTIQVGSSKSWTRTGTMVAFLDKDGNGDITMLKVTPGEAYNIV